MIERSNNNRITHQTMAKYVPDISSRRWVIISTRRNGRPDDVREHEKDPVDPFAPGNEAQTSKEVFRIGPGEPGTPGWEVRVIENKYPISDFHEVVIHGPGEEDLHEMDPDQAHKVFEAFRERFNYYCKQGHVILFCNRGEHAGASLTHPHTQLVVLPHQINLSTIAREPKDNMVKSTEHFDVYCPDFSQWPYEVWIAPKREDTLFGSITDVEITDLVELYQEIMKKLEVIYAEKSKTGPGFSYNFYIYPGENWYMRIIPRMAYRAGFELGTGLSVNTTDPEDAATELRGGVPFEGEVGQKEQGSKSMPKAPNVKNDLSGNAMEERTEPEKTPEEKIEDVKAKLARLGV